MRLVNTHSRRLENFYQHPIEPYAILSHTWGKEEEELSFRDMMAVDKDHSVGERTAKLEGCCAQAQKDGIKYVWIDTCCIDKTNAVELGEAINSMFRWYQKSAICYTYLSDIQPGLSARDLVPSSRWFTRGWTLQELLASPKITFFDSAWNLLGTKPVLAGLIGQATGIPHHILTGIAGLDTASVAQRMSWAAKRTTTRPEDMAYCLLGIFEVMIPPLYGEGLEAAFERLQEAIMKKTRDDSILAWSLGSMGDMMRIALAAPISGGVLASSPAAFEGCGDIVQRSQTETQIQAFEIFGGTMPISIALINPGAEISRIHEVPVLYGYLSCGPKRHPDDCVAIPLVECSSAERGSSSHSPPVFLRPRSLNAICLGRPNDIIPPQTILIRKDRAGDGTQSEDKSDWFYLPGPYPWNATLDEVYPPESFDSEKAMIKTPHGGVGMEKTLFLVRFSYLTKPAGHDLEVVRQLILGLEFFGGSMETREEPRPYLFVDDHNKPTLLSEIPEFWSSLAALRATKICIENPLMGWDVRVKIDTIAGHRLWVVTLLDLPPAELRGHPISPVASHQITLCKEGHALVRCVRARAAVARQVEKSAKVLKSSEKRIDDTNKELEYATKKIVEWKAIAEQLQYKMERQLGHQSMLRHLVQAQGVELDSMDNEVAKMEKAAGIKRVPELPPSPTLVQARQLEGLVAYMMQQDLLRVNGKDIVWVEGMTLLMYAATTGSRRFVQWASHYDADLGAMDSAGRTALDWIVLVHGPASAKVLRDWVKPWVKPSVSKQVHVETTVQLLETPMIREIYPLKQRAGGQTNQTPLQQVHDSDISPLPSPSNLRREDASDATTTVLSNSEQEEQKRQQQEEQGNGGQPTPRPLQRQNTLLRVQISKGAVSTALMKSQDSTGGHDTERATSGQGSEELTKLDKAKGSKSWRKDVARRLFKVAPATTIATKLR
ncbi:hypothetical protein B0H63DRAFT_555214 [Podospora didyma]|uniref:Heterokaryon incompatibility domain-containing protein n=1 Tax=Podospora didyma TaxID=330526 RepID=A0AAE0U7J1_9PEZI|nr:hypothetical protein B0H63DRAFT_555214 [Podospora didyma]